MAATGGDLAAVHAGARVMGLMVYSYHRDLGGAERIPLEAAFRGTASVQQTLALMEVLTRSRRKFGLARMLKGIGRYLRKRSKRRERVGHWSGLGEDPTIGQAAACIDDISSVCQVDWAADSYRRIHRVEYRWKAYPRICGAYSRR
jgi:hypothetical protein